MKKYFTLLQLSWQNGLVYKTSLFLWRLRQFLSSIMALTIWSVVYASGTHTFGYSRDQMISYVFLASVLQSIVIATSLNGLTGRIYSGDISNQLLKPVNIFGYLITEEIADKLKNFLFILVESAILFLLFRPHLIVPDVTHATFFVLSTLLGILLHFCIQLIFGSFGFWSPDTWGPRFLFFMFLDFTAGKLFPIDILPKMLQHFIFLTPFPYLSFVQTEIFLMRLQTLQMIQSLFVLVCWIALTGFFALKLWKVGLKNYTAAGQ